MNHYSIKEDFVVRTSALVIATLFVTGVADAASIPDSSILSLKMGMNFDDALSFLKDRVPTAETILYGSTDPDGDKYTFGLRWSVFANGHDNVAKAFAVENKYEWEALSVTHISSFSRSTSPRPA
jgi:hypothetical protein